MNSPQTATAPPAPATPGSHLPALRELLRQRRFAEVLTANRHKSAAEIVAAVNQALTEFAAGSPPADDITLIVSRRV